MNLGTRLALAFAAVAAAVDGHEEVLHTAVADLPVPRGTGAVTGPGSWSRSASHPTAPSRPSVGRR